MDTIFKSAVGIMSIILAAACHPEAQARVREELDLVVGRDRGRRIPIHQGH